MKTERRPVTPDEAVAVKYLGHVTYPVASWDKRFARHMGEVEGITDKEAPQVWRLFKKYRRQIACPDKARLLALADTLSAPDLRKEAALREIREKYDQAMKGVQA